MNFVEVVLVIVLGMLLIILREYVTSRSKKLGEIEETIANLPKATEIQTALTDAIQNVEYGYWQQQQINQVRRQKIEEILHLLYEETVVFSETHHNYLTNLDFKELKANHMIGVLITLYFRDLYNPLVIDYQHACANYNGAYKDIHLKTDINVGLTHDNNFILNQFFDQYGKAHDSLYDKLIKSSEGLTFNSNIKSTR